MGGHCCLQEVATREVAAILGIHSQRDKSHANSRQSMIVQAPEEGADVVTAAKRVLMSSQLESLGLRDKRDMSMLIAQSALQVWVLHCGCVDEGSGASLGGQGQLGGMDWLCCCCQRKSCCLHVHL